MKLVSLQIPNMWYHFTNVNNQNQFTIKLYNMKGFPDIEHLVVIPEGNYTSDNMETALNNYFVNIGKGLNFLYFEINPLTSRSIIRARHPTDAIPGPCAFDPTNQYYSPDFYFILEFGNTNFSKTLHLTSGWALGFSTPSYTVTKNNTYVDIIKYPSPTTYNCYLNSETSFGRGINNYVFIEIDDFNKNFITNSVMSSIGNTYIGNNILGRLTITSNHNSMVDVDCSDGIFKVREYFGPVNIEKMRIRILDKFGHVLDLNGNDYSFALDLSIIYN